MRYHPLAWLLWWLATLVAALLTQNPLYHCLILLAALWVRTVAVQRVRDQQTTQLIGLRLGLVILGLTTLVNSLTIHLGATVLVRLPDWLPIIGGPITLEAMTFGFSSGLALLTLLAIFAAFNAAADYQGLLRFMPSFLFQAGLVTSIALAFVPQTVRALDEIREAQMIRGHRFRGWRDLPPLFLPLLTSGLERSIQLAEAMESRGFGSPRVGPEGTLRAAPPLWPPVAILAGLLGVVMGVGLLLLAPTPWVPLGIALVGVALLGVGLRASAQGSGVRRTRYRPQPWRRADRVLAIGSVVVMVWLLGIKLSNPGALVFYPYPRLLFPPFAPLIGGLLLCLSLPVWLWEDREVIAEREKEPYDGTVE